MVDESGVSHFCPSQIDRKTEEVLCATRNKFLYWGPRKIKVYLLRCEIVIEPKTVPVKEVFESASLLQSGQIMALPFALTGIGGLSGLSVGWTRLGIRHERMHLTQKRKLA